MPRQDGGVRVGHGQVMSCQCHPLLLSTPPTADDAPESLPGISHEPVLSRRVGHEGGPRLRRGEQH